MRRVAGLEPGTAADAGAVVRLRDAAAEWLLARGIEQWRPGETSAARVVERAAAGELFVARDGGAVVGAVVIRYSDELVVWGPDAGDAGYVHTLVIDRRYAGRGLGRTVLALAEREIAARGRGSSRLDCVAGNPVLRRYYRDAGYAEVGERSFAAWSPVTLFEKRVSGAG